MLSRILGYLVTFGLLVLVLDGVLRLAGCSPSPTINQFDPTLGWSKEPSTVTEKSTSEFDVTYSINSRGLRGEEAAYEKPEGKTRILVVGDSFTLGYTVNEEDLFLRVLEKELRSHGHDVEILNGGTEGYSTDQELLWLREEGLKYSPDYVVLAPYLNDVYWNTQDAYFDKAKPLFEEGSGESIVLMSGALDDTGKTPWWKKNTAIGDLVRKMELGKYMSNHLTKVGGKTVFLEDAPLLSDPPPIIEEAWARTGALIYGFGETVREAGAVPIALPIPNRWEIQGDQEPPPGLRKYSIGDLDPGLPTRRLAEAAEEAGFVVVNPTHDLLDASKKERVYHEKDWHWNVAGNRVVAHALLNRLLMEDMLGPGNTAMIPENDALSASSSSSASGISIWLWLPALLWLVLSTLYWRSNLRENVVTCFLEVGLLVTFVAGVLFGVHRLAEFLPPAVGKWLIPAVVVLILGFILVKAGRRISTISELYGVFLRRGHWYLLPMLVVILSIGMLLVVAASSPFVAPFIYTLF